MLRGKRCVCGCTKWFIYLIYCVLLSCATCGLRCVSSRGGDTKDLDPSPTHRQTLMGRKDGRQVENVREIIGGCCQQSLRCGARAAEGDGSMLLQHSRAQILQPLPSKLIVLPCTWYSTGWWRRRCRDGCGWRRHPSGDAPCSSSARSRPTDYGASCGTASTWPHLPPG